MGIKYKRLPLEIYIKHMQHATRDLTLISLFLHELLIDLDLMQKVKKYSCELHFSCVYTINNVIILVSDLHTLLFKYT